MPNAHPSLPPAHLVDDAAGRLGAAAHAWPVLAAGAAAVAAAVLAWHAWPGAATDAGSLGVTALAGLAAVALPLWLARQLWRVDRAARDQSRRLQAQHTQLQALARSHELLCLAEQVAQLGSFDWNPATGALHWSDEHYRLWGHAPGALTPDYAAFRARIHADDVDGLELRLQHALQTGGTYECTHRVCWPDGTVLDVLARGNVTRDATGRAVRMVGTVLDITRRRADEARLQMHAFALDTITDPVAQTLDQITGAPDKLIDTRDLVTRADRPGRTVAFERGGIDAPFVGGDGNDPQAQPPGDGLGRELADGLGVEQHPPGLRREHPGERLEQRRLAARVRPDDDRQLALGNGDVDIAEHRVLGVVGDAQPLPT